VTQQGELSEEEKRKVIFHRHAEAIIPDETDLSALKWIVSRSEAEAHTLQNSVSPLCWRKYKPITVFGSRGNLFFRWWTFVESVDLQHNRVTFSFNQNTKCAGPFAAALTVLDSSIQQRYVWGQEDFRVADTLAIDIPQLVKPKPYELTFMLDTYTVYRGKYSVPGELF
jgi:hypothetical protein